MNIGSKKKIVILGMISKMPVAGVVWQYMHYLIGFQRLGYDVYYVESHAHAPTMLMESKNDDGTKKAVAHLATIMRRFDLTDRWAFHAIHDDCQCYGMTELQLKELYRTADLIINMHGGTLPLPEHYATGRLVYCFFSAILVSPPKTVLCQTDRKLCLPGSALPEAVGHNKAILPLYHFMG